MKLSDKLINGLGAKFTNKLFTKPVVTMPNGYCREITFEEYVQMHILESQIGVSERVSYSLRRYREL